LVNFETRLLKVLPAINSLTVIQIPFNVLLYGFLMLF
jgi:hypothetical protein